MKTQIFRLSLTIAFIAFIAFSIASQTSARVSGTIKDPNGAVVAGAQITLRGTISRAVLTDEKGDFTLQNVPPGDYELRVSSNGFAEQSQRLTVSGEGQKLDIQLDIES